MDRLPFGNGQAGVRQAGCAADNNHDQNQQADTIEPPPDHGSAFVDALIVP